MGGSSVPVPRLARSLPAEAAAAHALRARHNDALRQLFAETGIPLGSAPSNIVLRTSALELINAAITNRVELAETDGITADEVAYAAGDFIGRYILGETNAPVLSAGVSARVPRQAIPRAASAADLLIVGDSHAACRLPHSSVDAWTVAEILQVPASNRLAVSGSTAAQWAADHNGWLSAAVSNRAPVVWISLGGNDAAAIAADGRVDPAEVRAACSNFYEVVSALAFGRRLVVVTAYADPYQGARQDVAADVLALNSALRLQTARACSPLNAMFPLMEEIGVPFRVLEEPEILSASNYDGSGDLHPNASGYTNMALRLQSLIKETTK